MKIAVQLYSVRDCINNGEDMLSVLGKIKAMGYDGVEFAGYAGLDPKDLKARLDELGLVCVGSHIGCDDFKPENISKTISDAKALGTKYIGVGGGPIGNAEEIMKTSSIMSYGSVVAAKEGVTVYFHNHTNEFKEVDGIRPIDMLSKACALEVDTYWSFCAGIDNYKFITENKDNICLLHIKDGIGEQTLTLGKGNCDIKTALDAAKDAGIEWIIVENDDPKPNGLDDVEQSINYLKSIL